MIPALALLRAALVCGPIAALITCSPPGPECGGRDSDPCPLGETCIAGQCTAESWPARPQALVVDAGAEGGP